MKCFLNIKKEIAGNIYSFGDGLLKDFNSFANGQPSIENTAAASGGVLGGAIGGVMFQIWCYSKKNHP